MLYFESENKLSFITLSPGIYSLVGRFESYLLGNVKDRFSCIGLFVALRPRQQLSWSWRVGQFTTLFLGKFEQAVNQYFVHILLFVTDNNPFRTIHRKGGGSS